MEIAKLPHSLRSPERPTLFLQAPFQNSTGCRRFKKKKKVQEGCREMPNINKLLPTQAASCGVPLLGAETPNLSWLGGAACRELWALT